MSKILFPPTSALFRAFLSHLGPLTNGHLAWRGDFDSDGHGRTYWGGTMQQAHRIAWVLLHGEIPAGLVLRHRCEGRRDCVNTQHLELGTVAQNNADKMAQGRQARGPQCWNLERKLSPEQLAELRTLVAEGHSGPKLAARFGINRKSVNRIARALEATG